MLNGAGFTYDRIAHLWLVDVDTGAATRLTAGRAADREPAWSPDGQRIAFTSNRRRDADILSSRLDIHVVDVVSRAVTAVTRGPRSMFTAPAWLPDGRTIAALGHRLEGGAGSRNDVWLFAADGSDATPTGGRNLSAAHDLMPGSGMGSDVTRGEAPVMIPSKGGRWLHLSAPDRRRLRAVAAPRHRRSPRPADRGPPLRLGLACRPGRRWPWSRRDQDRLPALDADRAAGPVAARYRRLRVVEAAPADALQ